MTMEADLTAIEDDLLDDDMMEEEAEEEDVDVETESVALVPASPPAQPAARPTLTPQEAQGAIAKVLTTYRDARLAKGTPTLTAVLGAVPGAAVAVRVDTPQSAVRAAKQGAKSFEAAMDDLAEDLDDVDDSILGDGDLEANADAIPRGEAGGPSRLPASRELINLTFARPDHKHNIHAWKQGDDVNVAMKVRKADGQTRVVTATTSHEAELQKLVGCLRSLGYTPDKILRLPLKELAARLGASKLIPTVAKNVGAVLGLETRAQAPYHVSLK